MARSNIPAGNCTNCGGQLLVRMKFCSFCGLPVDTNTRVITSESLLPVSSSVPTSPHPQSTFEPTIEQKMEKFHQAITSDVNPYADWGTLELDDRSQRIWEEYTAGDVSCQYAGDAFSITNIGRTFARGHIFTDFAFQVLVQSSLPSYSASESQSWLSNLMRVGLLFRDDDQTAGYSLELQQEHETGPDRRYTAHIYLGSYLGNKGLHTSIHSYSVSGRGKGTRPDMIGISMAEPNLLAVVVQGSMIDVYLNLAHLGRKHDFNISKGMVGIEVLGKHAGIFTNAKVWVKE